MDQDQDVNIYDIRVTKFNKLSNKQIYKDKSSLLTIKVNILNKNLGIGLIS